MEKGAFETISSLFDGASKEDDELLVKCGLIEVLISILKNSKDDIWIMKEKNRFLPFQTLNYLESLINANTEFQKKIYSLGGLNEILSFLKPMDKPGNTWIESYAALNIINTRVHWGDQGIYNQKNLISDFFYWYKYSIEKVYKEYQNEIKYDYHKYYILKFNRDKKSIEESSIDWGIEMLQWSSSILRWLSLEIEFKDYFLKEDYFFNSLEYNFQLLPLNDLLIGNLIITLENLIKEIEIKKKLVKNQEVLKILMRFYLSGFFEKYHESLEKIFQSFLEEPTGNLNQIFCEILDDYLISLVESKNSFYHQKISTLNFNLKSTEMVKAMKDQIPLESLDDVIKMKQEGNSYFKSQNFEKAIEIYENCLAVCSFNQTAERSLILSNMSECYLKLNQFDNALVTSLRSLTLNHFNFKSLFRRSRSYEGLNLRNFQLYDLIEFDKLTKSKYHEPVKDELKKNFYEKLKEKYGK
eukprot:gene1546-12672_t